ncbi:MAG: S8 family serine peptidase [Bacteroidales bacterium]|nr:S8 family serine peptidase [Bacteroidales bacterium]
MKKITIFFLFISFMGLAQLASSQHRGPEPVNHEKEKLLQLADSLHAKHLRQRAEVEKMALQNGWSIRTESEFGETEYQYIDELGMPQAYTTYNLNSAITTGTNQLWPGGTTGLNLNGNAYLIGIWDGGGVRTTHQEFGGRVTIIDGASLSNHSTHVGGTMVASGVQNAARGMASQATLRSYDWTDDYAEMATEAAIGLTLSNHSYGWNRGWNSSGGNMYWWGTTSISATEDYLFGFYDATARDLDIVAVNAPNYLIVWAAANDRDDTWSGGHYVRDGGGNWVWSTATRDQDGGADGFDCIPQQGIAKNILTVGAVNDIPGGYSNPADVVATVFTSWGPADDGRIKPDIVANGASLYSTSSAGNASYTTMSGTSMASPSVTGTLALLQEHYTNVRGRAMSAAALKGLVINTADEAGPNDGPDYMFGWGLLDAVGAAEKITQDDTEGGLIVQGVLNNGQTIDYTYYSDGSEINVTLCWTDPAGTPPAASLNPSANMLVNDLDFRVIGSATYLPWQANRTFPSSPAYKNDNTRDNVETVNVKTPAPGFYTLRINHKGALTGGQQEYAMIISGLNVPPAETYCDARATSTNFEYISRVQFGSVNNYSSRAPGGYHDYRGLVTSLNKGSNQTLTVTMPGGAASSLGRVYIDWNQDGDFADSNENIILGSGAGPTYSTTISVPANALGGYTTMRVRVGFSTVPPACGNVTYGETEDYTIRVVGTPGLWTGTKSNDWFNPKNWHDGNVPTQTVNVTIPSSAPYQPVIGDGKTARCNVLVIQSGAVLTQNSISYFYVYGNFDSDAGQFIMNGSTSYLYFAGTTNTWWDDDNENDIYTNIRVLKDVPTATLTMWQDMTCSGTFEVREGIFAIDASWTLTVTNTSTSAFRVEDGGILRLSGAKSIDIAGRVYFANGSNTDITGGTIRCKANFRVDNNTSYDISLTGATLVLNGAGSQLIEDLDGGSLQLHHLIIDKPGGTASIGNANLNIAGNLTIQSGPFSLGGYACNVAGTTDIYGTLVMTNPANNLTTGIIDWNSGSTANVTAGNFYVNTMWDFKAGCNAQITPGNTAYVRNMQYPTESTAHFGNLVIQPLSAITGNGEDRSIYPVNVAGNMTILTGASWGFNGPSGMVVSGNSIIQNGATLSFYSSAVFNTSGSLDISGTLSLNSSANSLVNAGFSFPASGTINIDNATFISDNAFTGGWTTLNGSFNMASGLFELTNNAPNFTASASTSIGGGIVRAGVTMSADFPNFNPTGGVVEITGVFDGNLFMGPGSSFHDLTYNSVSGNTLFYQNNITVRRHLTISAGTVRPQNNTLVLNVGGNFTNSSPHTGYNPLQALVVFNGDGAANHQHVNGPINFYDVTNAKTGGGELRFTGAANIANNFIANNVNVVSGSALNVAGLLDLSTGQLNLTNAGPNVTVNNFTMGGTLGVAGGSFVCTDVTNNGIFGTINLSNGLITLHQDPAQWTDLRGTFTISGGTFEIVGGNGQSWWAFGGTPTHVQITNGVLDFIDNGIFIENGVPLTTAISGGTIKSSGSILINHPNFNPSGGLTELYGSADRVIYTNNNSHFYNLRVNKSGGSLLGFESSEDEQVSDNVTRDLNLDNQSSDLNEGDRPKFDFPSGRSGNTVLTNGVVKIISNLNVDAGTLVIGNSVTNGGNATINAGAKLEFNPSGSLAMGASKALTVNNGGVLELNGTLSDQPKISRISAGNFAFNIESGGTIGAEYALFEHMNTSGINIKAGAIVDHSKAFHYCTFRNGQSGGRLLTINNSQTFAVNYANFPNNTWGGNYNVYKSVTAGVVTFGGYTGLFSGETNEFDPNSRLHWGGEIAPMVSLQGVDIVNGQELCYEATNTLTIAGGGTTFDVQNGAVVNLVAGQKISMLDGTHFHNGSYVLARITTTSDYCALPPALLAFGEEKSEDAEITTHLNEESGLFRVYPNPTTGRFTIELSEIAKTVMVEIYGVMGEQILRQEVSGFMMYELDLSSQPRGIYIVRVLSGDELEIQRVIRQ